jgi:phosphopantetheinyl transferase
MANLISFVLRRRRTCASSTSRTKDIAIFAVSAGREVVVDVETFDLSQVALADVATHALTARERAVLNSCSNFDRYAGYLKAWVRKRPYLKARGTGLIISPGDVDTQPDSGRIFLSGKLVPEWRVYDLTIDDSCVAAIAAESTESRVVLREFKFIV